MKLLLQTGATLDTSEPERNPLFSAIYGGHAELVALLVEHGIDHKVSYTGLRKTEKDGAAYARERGQLAIAAFLEGCRPFRK